MKLCSIEGCERRHDAKGYCSMHYRRLKKYGDVNFVKKDVNQDGICIVHNCNNKMHAKGYCSLHYNRFKKYKNPLEVRQIQDHTGTIEKCSVPKCSKHVHLNGYCKMHNKRFLKYGDTSKHTTENHLMSESSEYYTWSSMKARCSNPKIERYPRYGGRGISVCGKWKNSFSAFYKDMGPKPFIGAQIDRIDNDGNYEPSNCRWVTPAENSMNRSTCKHLKALKSG